MGARRLSCVCVRPLPRVFAESLDLSIAWGKDGSEAALLCLRGCPALSSHPNFQESWCPLKAILSLGLE